MFQGMFHKRGRPPEQLPIGGSEKPNEEETGQIPVHQSLVPLETPRQLPLPSVGEFEHVVMQQEDIVGNDLSVQPMLSQQSDIISSSKDKRSANNPLQVMSPNHAIPSESGGRHF